MMMMSNPSSQIRRVGSPRAHVDVVPRILRPVAARRLAVPVKVIKSFSFDDPDLLAIVGWGEY